ncbi:hypothetical protein ACJJTC_018723 [Scirpophaga incertulas]
MRYVIRFYMCLIFKAIVCEPSKEFVNTFNNMILTVEGKLIGGKAVTIDKFPSSVQFFNQGNFCAGTILNSWTVMTAAHCFDFNKNVENMLIHVGTSHMYDRNAKVHEVDYIVIHEDYNKPLPFACDIALIFLETPIELNNKTKKGIIVNTNKWMSAKEKDFEITGWGYTSYGGSLSKLGLMMAVLKYVSWKKCEKMNNLDLSSDMFCLYGDGLTDTCQGDSGGSVLWNKMVVGIVSHGEGCAKKGKPSIYTNVLYFRDWIKSKVKKFFLEYCERKGAITYVAKTN